MNPMPDQEHYWSKAAASYESEFIDPYLPDVRDNPLKRVLGKLAERGGRVVADLGCGVGPLLPFLAERFAKVYAVDFAEGMLARARATAGDAKNIAWLRTGLADLGGVDEPLDVAVSVNSLVMPSVAEQDAVLRTIHDRLKPGGVFLGILPAMDAVHYYTMLLIDSALERGMPLEAARKNAAHQAEHEFYDFAFGQFRFQGLEQHFWQPFEARHRLRRAGFTRLRLRKVYLSWQQFSARDKLKQYDPPWDWFFLAKRPMLPKPG